MHPGKQPQVETESVLPQTKGRPLFIEKVLILVPDWSVFMLMKNPSLHSLIGWNNTF